MVDNHQVVDAGKRGGPFDVLAGMGELERPR